MKRVGHLYEQMCEPENIRAAIYKAAKKKHKRYDVRKVLNSIDYYVEKVRDVLVNETYTPSPYHISERYDHRSKKTRLVYRPKFFDLIVQWILIEAIEPVIMRGMYHWSCGSIKGRGGKRAHKAIKRILRDKKYKYCLQIDIKKFYESIPHDILIEKFRRKIKDEKVLRLLEKIIKSVDKGVSIGSYHSQWVANFLLEEIDHYIAEQDGIKHVRYIDDLPIIGRNKRKLHKLLRELNAMFAELGLEIKDNWQVFKIENRGIDFIGHRFFHTHTKVRKRIFIGLTRQARRIKNKQKRMETPSFRQAAGFISRLGWLKGCNSFTIRKKYVDGIKINRLKEIVKNENKKQLRAAAS